MTRTLQTAICATMALAMAACSDRMDYHEYVVKDKEQITATFEDVGGFMTDIYNHVDYDYGQYYSGAVLGSASDEAEYALQGNAIEDFYNGAWSATNAKETLWNDMYEGIAACNVYIDEFTGLTFDDLALNSDYEKQLYRYNNYEWEARFMRAYFYFVLARQYGGVPLVTHTQSYDITNALPRESSDSIFSFIISECDAIKDSIIADYSDLGAMDMGANETGRADRLAVLALKARAALYWASPLFNPDDDATRWYNAALYTKQLIDECTERGKRLADDYESLWATDNYSNANIICEIIFGRRVYGSGSEGVSSTFESYNYPVGIEGGNGGNCPTQTLVDAYEFVSGDSAGLRPKDLADYDPDKPYYDDRDPRFYVTVAKNGDENWPSSNTTPLQTYYGGINAEPLTGGTPTGYYVKKLCHSAIDLSSNSSYEADNHTWVTFRLGEFYLNYAEAVFKYLGSQYATDGELTMSAADALDKTRLRAGLKSLSEVRPGMTNDEFWDVYKTERMVELAFEGHRFWDVRRWKEADEHFTSVDEMKLTLNSDSTISYERNTVSRTWDDKIYLFPIPQSEIQKNPNLTQNPGW